MDTEAAALLTTAEMTVVSLMATDAWQRTHDGLVQLWQRFRPEHAEAVGRELAARRAIIVTVPAVEAGPGLGLGPLWARELPEILADPQAARDLEALLLACGRATAAQSSGAEKVRQDQRVVATSNGHGRAYAAGRDMKIDERPDVES